MEPGHQAEDEAGQEMNVLQDVDLLVLQAGTQASKEAGARIKAYIIMVTILMLVFLALWLAK